MRNTPEDHTVRDYFSRAFHLDTSINNKLELVASLRSQATKTPATLSDLPRTDSPNPKKLEGLLVKLFDLENEITADIDALVDTKREIIETIKRLQRSEYQVLLEMRYLCFKTWPEISAAMNIDPRYTYTLHNSALRAAKKIISRPAEKSIVYQG